MADEQDQGIPPPWDDVKDRFHPDEEGDLDYWKRQYEAARSVAISRAAMNRPGSGGEGIGQYLLRRSLPFLSSAYNAEQSSQVSQSRERISSGTHSFEDIQRVAAHENQQQREQDQGVGGSILSGLASVPAVVGEAYGGGAALRGIGIGAQAAPGLLNFAGRTAAQTAVMPSMWLPQWTQDNLAAGRSATDPRGLPMAVTMGLLNTAVLGSMSSIANGIGGAGLRGIAVRTLARTGAGMLEQQGADVLGSLVGEMLPQAWKVQTKYGLFGHALRGEWGDFWKHAATQAVTFAAFSALHEVQSPHEAIQDIRDAVNSGETRPESLQNLQANIQEGVAEIQSQQQRPAAENATGSPTSPPSGQQAQTPAQQPPNAQPGPNPAIPTAPQPPQRPTINVAELKQLAKQLGMPTANKTPQQLVDDIRRIGGGPFIDQITRTGESIHPAAAQTIADHQAEVQDANRQLAKHGAASLTPGDHQRIGEIARQEAGRLAGDPEIVAEAERRIAESELHGPAEIRQAENRAGESPVGSGAPASSAGSGEAAQGPSTVPQAAPIPSAQGQAATVTPGVQHRTPERIPLPLAKDQISTANAPMNQIRHGAGLSELVKANEIGNREMLDRGRKMLVDNPGAGEQLVDRILNERRAVNDVEAAVLLQHASSLRQAHDKAASELNAARKEGSPERVTAAEHSYELARQGLDRVSEATRFSGEIGGRAHQLRQAIIADDFSISGLLKRAGASKGRELTKEETSRFTDAAEKEAALRKEQNDLGC